MESYPDEMAISEIILGSHGSDECGRCDRCDGCDKCERIGVC